LVNVIAFTVVLSLKEAPSVRYIWSRQLLSWCYYHT